KDILSSKFWIGFFLCFLGSTLTLDLLSERGVSLNFTGLMALTLAVLSSTLYRTQIEDIMDKIHPSKVSIAIFLLNAIFVGIFIFPWIPKISEKGLYLSLWMGIAAAMANLAFLTSIHLVGSVRMSIFDMLQRPLIIILATIIL